MLELRKGRTRAALLQTSCGGRPSLIIISGKLTRASFTRRKLARWKNCEASENIVTVSQIGRTMNLSIQGELGRLPCSFILDTGATKSIVRPDIVKHGKSLRKCNYTLKTATGENVPINGAITDCIKFGETVYEHEFLVANITDQCILGLDFMDKYGFIINFAGRTLKQGNMEYSLANEEAEASVRRVVLVDDVMIPPMSEYIVWAKLDNYPKNQHIAVIEPRREPSLDYIMTGKSLVVTGPRQLVPVRMMNLSESEKLICAGSHIANCEDVDFVKGCEEEIAGGHHSNHKSKNTEMQNLLTSVKNSTSAAQFTRVKQMLEEFQDIFSAGEGDCGRTTLVKHRIDTGNAQPIRQHPRRLPLAKVQESSAIIDEMYKNGVIESSHSPWSAPVVLVNKKDGSSRFCVDYRLLNEITKKDSYPLPRIDDTLDTLAGSMMFSTLDLKSGYWQVEVHPEDREKTAFSIGNGLWQFKMMPFGLCNAPGTFERLMEQVLKGLNWKTCLVYLDDIIVLGRTFDEHIQNLCEVFSRIRSAGLKLNSKKCSLFQSKVKYLGHLITSNGVSTDPDKIKAVKEWPVPENIHELRSFIGFCTYYRRFVPNFAMIARSLHDLTEKGKPFKWTAACMESFERLKAALCSAPVLAYPKPGETFILDTDASNNGI